MTVYEESIKLHEKHKGKIEIMSKVPVNDKNSLSLAYTPGVAEPCRRIDKNKEDVYRYTSKGNMVAVVTDGSAVLGLGNIGPEAALPVMEGKSILFKEFGGIDAFPICLDTQDAEEIIKAVKLIAPSFGGINLEDISAPRCFEIEKRLKEELDIPVFHDDQHGTAIVVLAGLINSLKITGKTKESKIVISGAGAAGIAITRLLYLYGLKNIVLCDSQGIVSRDRENLSPVKEEILDITNRDDISGSLADALKGSDIFIGVSAPDIVSKDMIRSMNSPIIFAMANPVPEIPPEDAKEAGAAIIATGRSDFPNQVNNVLAFPGVFKGALKMRMKITDPMKIAAAEALASLVKEPSPEKIIPSPFDDGAADAVADAVEGAQGDNNLDD